MYKQNKVEQFYNDYGQREWERLDQSAYHRLMYILHTDFLDPYIGNDKKVLDAGCGAGRFSIYMAQQGSQITLLDISQTQLDIAKQKCLEAGINNNINKFIHASVTDMKVIPDNSFDTVICYGAVLNYLHESVIQAISELIRVTKNGGEILISVNNRNGVLRSNVTQLKFPLLDFWGKPKDWGIYEVIDTGNETDYPGAKQPPRHFFTADELKKSLNTQNLTNVELGAAPSIMTGLCDNAEILSQNQTAWETILYMEKSQYLNEAIVDCGEFLMARAKVTK